MSPILGIYASQISGHLFTFPASSYESIASTTVGAGGSSTVTFSSIPSTYTHLQIRSLNRGGSSGNVRFNSDTGNNYTRHYLEGTGTSAVAGGASSQPYIDIFGNTTTASIFAVNIIDILDYANTNKYKTARNLSGVDTNGGGYVGIQSGLWMNSSAISTITLTSAGGNFAQYSSFALYGIKAI